MLKSTPQILLAEDDSNLSALLNDILSKAGFQVNHYFNGELALQAFQKSTYDICLLDVMMPQLDGFELAKRIKKMKPQIPIIFITAKSLKSDKLNGYELGADDYITKPFDAEELIWKIHAILRRQKETLIQPINGEVSLGMYRFNPQTLSLSIGSNTKRITQKECEILSYLFVHRNAIIKRESMLLDLWGEDDYFLGRSLDVFITKIRKYLKDDESLSIENVFGVGFIFNTPN